MVTRDNHPLTEPRERQYAATVAEPGGRIEEGRLTCARLTLPSDPRWADLVHAAAEKMALTVGFTEDAALDLGLAAREAAINACRHGNQCDALKPVRVELVRIPEGLRVDVRDYGGGFDPASTPDPTEPGQRMKTSGRGLLIMRAFVDELQFEYDPSEGMTVTMIKRLPRGVEAAGSRDRTTVESGGSQ